MEIREKLKKKKAQKKVSQFISDLNSMELVEFIDDGIVSEIQTVLNNFHSSKSVPISTISNNTEAPNIITWIQENLSSLITANDTQFIFTYGDIDEPLWIKVQTENVKEALHELWENSETKEFVFVHESMKIIYAIFSEEELFEIHKGSW